MKHHVFILQLHQNPSMLCLNHRMYFMASVSQKQIISYFCCCFGSKQLGSCYFVFSQSRLRTWAENITEWKGERSLDMGIQGQNSKGTFGLLSHVQSMSKLTVQQKITKAVTAMQHNHLTCHLFSKLCLKVKCHFLDFLPCYTACFNVPSKQRKQLFPHQAYISYGEKKKNKSLLHALEKERSQGVCLDDKFL